VPVTYNIDAANGVIRTKVYGHVTLQEVVDHFQTLALDPECPQRAKVFLDLSETESLPDAPQISAVVVEVKKLRRKVSFDACAVLATRNALFGMMRMFEALAEDYFRVTRTFRVAAEAEAWLASQALWDEPRR
jgi:hypothetical protein